MYELKPFVFWDLFLFLFHYNTAKLFFRVHHANMSVKCTPLTPRLYIVIMGFTGVYIFSYFVLKRRLRVLVEAVLTCIHNLGLEQK